MALSRECARGLYGAELWIQRGLEERPTLCDAADEKGKRHRAVISGTEVRFISERATHYRAERATLYFLIVRVFTPFFYITFGLSCSVPVVRVCGWK